MTVWEFVWHFCFEAIYANANTSNRRNGNAYAASMLPDLLNERKSDERRQRRIDSALR